MRNEPSRKYRVAFICVKNSCRSQMAEALARHLASDVIDPVSGGTEPAENVDPGAVRAMREIGIDISRARPKQLSREILQSLDLVVHMGCGSEQCPFVPEIPSENWGIPDPVGEPIEKYREARDTIKSKVEDLATRLRLGKLSSESNPALSFEVSGPRA